MAWSRMAVDTTNGIHAPRRHRTPPIVTASDPLDRDTALRRVYDELRQLAEQRVREGLAGHTLQATAIVHEVWLKLAAEPALEFRDTHHFRALAAQAMRWFLVDQARRRGAGRRAHARDERTLSGIAAVGDDPDLVLELDDALRRLREVDDRKARVFELRHFAGLSVEETAETLGVSAPTVKREWAFARAWLARELGGG